MYPFKTKNTVYNWYFHITVDLYEVFFSFHQQMHTSQVNTVDTESNAASVEHSGA